MLLRKRKNGTETKTFKHKFGNNFHRTYVTLVVRVALRDSPEPEKTQMNDATPSNEISLLQILCNLRVISFLSSPFYFPFN